MRINAIIRRADEAASRREQQQHARAGNFSLSLSLFAYPMWNIQSMKCEGLNSRISGIPCRKRLSASDRSGTLDSSTGVRQSKGPETHCRSTVIALVRQRHVCVIDRYSWYGQHCWITHSLTHSLVDHYSVRLSHWTVGANPGSKRRQEERSSSRSNVR